MKLKTILIMAVSAISFGTGLHAQDNPWGLVYEQAITENIPGKVNIHPVKYNLDGIEIAANIYTPAGYNPDEKEYPAIIVAHPNGGTKEQVAGLFAQRLAEKGYITIAADASYQGASGGEPRHTDKPYFRINDIHGMADYISRYPGVEHWHGASPDSWFAHLAIECNPESNEVTWLGPVTDAEYLEATKNPESVTELIPRQQAIVAIASYAAIGDASGLTKALEQGLTAGMTVNEIKELLIQVYAYCGFPRSLTALGVFKNLLSERMAKGITDPEGESASVVSDIDKYGQGAKTLNELSVIPVDAPAPWYEDFAPGINRFLKEHLFADIFGRGVLPYTDREIATVSMLTALGGVEPMAIGHIGICRHLGVTTPQLNSLLDIIEYNIDPSKTEPIRKIVNR